MIIYLDLIFFMNFFYDFLILLTISLVLKRRASIKRLLIGSFVGSLSVLLFLVKNSLLFFSFKILFCFFINIISYKYISFRYTLNNCLYFYMVSVIIAGFLNLLSIELGIEIGYSLYFMVLFMFCPVVLYVYYVTCKRMESKYALYYPFEIYFDNNRIKLVGLFDSGNSLKDPVTDKPVIIVKRKIIDNINHIRSPIYVPYSTISGSGIVECYKPSKIIINSNIVNNYLIGFIDCKFADGVDAILNVKLLEDSYV